MSTKCLETKLKATVDNDALAKIGEVVIMMKDMPSTVPARAGILSVINPSIPTTVRILNKDRNITFTNGSRAFIIDNEVPEENRTLNVTKDTLIAIDNPSNVNINMITEHNLNIQKGMSLLKGYTNDLVFVKTYDAASDFFFTIDKIVPFLKIPILYGYQIKNDSYRGSLEEQIIEIVKEYSKKYVGRIFTISLIGVTLNINNTIYKEISHSFSFRVNSLDTITVYIDNRTIDDPEKIFAEYNNGVWTYHDIPL